MKAAVLEEISKPLVVREVSLSTHGDHDLLLEEGQVFVKMLVTGICGSQLKEIDGLKGDPAHCPHLLGHEGSAIVVKCGRSVTTVKEGDKVVVHWRKGSGIDAPPPIFGKLKAGRCTTFSEYTVISENRVTAIPEDVPNDFAALLGCCLSTALSIIENEVQPKPNDSILIIGCGGLGLALILASRLIPTLVFAVDCSPKLKLVANLGAYFVHASNTSKIGMKFDFVIDTVGTDWGRSFIKPDAKYISLQAGGTQAGGFNPTRDIPRYVQMWRDGKLNDYIKLITHRIKLEDINKGISLMRQGKAGRVLIEFDHGCPHVPKCFSESDSCWNYDESKKRAMSLPNFP